MLAWVPVPPLIPWPRSNQYFVPTVNPVKKANIAPDPLLFPLPGLIPTAPAGMVAPELGAVPVPYQICPNVKNEDVLFKSTATITNTLPLNLGVKEIAKPSAK